MYIVHSTAAWNTEQLCSSSLSLCVFVLLSFLRVYKMAYNIYFPCGCDLYRIWFRHLVLLLLSIRPSSTHKKLSCFMGTHFYGLLCARCANSKWFRTTIMHDRWFWEYRMKWMYKTHHGSAESKPLCTFKLWENVIYLDLSSSCSGAKVCVWARVKINVLFSVFAWHETHNSLSNCVCDAVEKLSTWKKAHVLVRDRMKMIFW